MLPSHQWVLSGAPLPLPLQEDSGKPLEGKLAPVAINNSDDAHNETDEDEITTPTCRDKSQMPEVGT